MTACEKNKAKQENSQPYTNIRWLELAYIIWYNMINSKGIEII